MDLDKLLVLAFVVTVAVAPIGGASAPPAVAGIPNLSGHWRLNEAESEDLGRKMSAAGRPRRHGRGARGRSEGDRSATIRDLIEATKEMTITHREKEIAVMDGGGRLRILHPDGRTHEASVGTEVKTHWEKKRLVVETRRERGARITETFGVGAEPGRLIVDIRIETRAGGTVTVKRVYDAVKVQ